MKRSYEDMVKELREIVRKIEDNGTTLDESIDLCERGYRLIKECEEILDRAELKINELAVE
ncbi:MAG: exodeoxyribonuclease VII small subunit [Methanomicrobiales archaeon]|nr:exodeoxyribonuclease VII small subunit [Methanomicrobiales archaeon]